MIDEKNLPEGWKVFTLGKVCKLKNGYAFKSTDYVSDGVPVIRISDIKEGIVTSKKSVKVYPNGEYQNYLISNNDILVAMSGATTGKFGIFRSNEIAYQNQRVGKFQILDSKVLNNEFLLYQLHSLKRQIEKDAYGGAQPNISSTKIEQMEIVVPSLNQQKNIVEKIEELFSELDKGIENLKTAQQQLKVYRQAVLKWAFEGKLTNYNIKDGEIPEGWAELPMGTVIEKPTYGTSKKCDYPPNGRGVLRIPNIINGIVDASDLKYAEFDKSEINAYNLKDGDLLIIRSNGSVSIVGKCALITKKEENLLYAGYLIRLRPMKKLVNPKYLSYILSSSNLRIQIENKAKSTSGVNNINANELKDLIITICSIEEQSKVVQEIESRLSVCDNIEETLNNSLRQAEALRQSILKKAFEGKLVKPEAQQEAKVISINAMRDVWERKVLAGKIIFACHKDRSFGTTKFQKLLYLCEQHSQLEFATHYSKQAAGPLDAAFIYPFIREAEKKEWFTQDTNTAPHHFEPLNGLGKLTSDYPKFFKHVSDKINFVINLLKDKNTDDSELVATIYAIWNNYIIKKQILTAEILPNEVYDWSDSKAKFTIPQILAMWKWMKEVNLVSVGFGKLIEKSNSRLQDTHQE